MARARESQRPPPVTPRALCPWFDATAGFRRALPGRCCGSMSRIALLMIVRRAQERAHSLNTRFPEIDYRAAKRDWIQASDIAKTLGEDEWVNRASGELGLIAFLEGNSGRAARLLGEALLSTMASGDTGGQIRFLELVGAGFEEVSRHAEAARFFERAITLADADNDSGLPFMAYEGKAQG